MNKLLEWLKKRLKKKLTTKTITKKVIKEKNIQPKTNENIQLSEFISKDSEFYGARRTIAIVTTVGFLLITMLIIGIKDIPISILFEMWKIMAFVYMLVVSSYFYSKLKLYMGMFR